MNIRRLEELSLNAWPALQTLVVDGWLVRFANGYTRRANSVNPLYAPNGDVEQNIAACEALFAARGLRTTFKLTPASQPPDLDDRLAQRGYLRDAETSVQTLALGDASRLQGAPAADTSRAPSVVALAPALTGEWFAAHVAISGLAPAHHATARTMLTMLGDVQSVGAKHSVPADSSDAAGEAECFAPTPSAPPTATNTERVAPTPSAPPTAANGKCFAPTFAHMVEAGQPVACGLAVAERGHVGCFDIAVHPAHRRRGHARRLMLDLLAWGQAQGAHTAYLQVMGNSVAALALYAQLGFREQYRYWYRVQFAPRPDPR